MLLLRCLSFLISICSSAYGTRKRSLFEIVSWKKTRPLFVCPEKNHNGLSSSCSENQKPTSYSTWCKCATLLSATSKRFTIEPHCFHIGQFEVLVQMGLAGAVGGELIVFTPALALVCFHVNQTIKTPSWTA